MRRRMDPVISKYIYGHFAEHLGRCIYDGIWVGPDSSIPNINGYREKMFSEALKALNMPVLRWPGGCLPIPTTGKDGIGPKADRHEDHEMFSEEEPWKTTVSERMSS